MAPSTPPPPRRELLAALQMAPPASWVISDRSASRRNFIDAIGDYKGVVRSLFRSCFQLGFGQERLDVLLEFVSIYQARLICCSDSSVPVNQERIGQALDSVTLLGCVI